MNRSAPQNEVEVEGKNLEKSKQESTDKHDAREENRSDMIESSTLT